MGAENQNAAKAVYGMPSLLDWPHARSAAGEARVVPERKRPALEHVAPSWQVQPPGVYLAGLGRRGIGDRRSAGPLAPYFVDHPGRTSAWLRGRIHRTHTRDPQGQ